MTLAGRKYYDLGINAHSRIADDPPCDHLHERMHFIYRELVRHTRSRRLDLIVGPLAVSICLLPQTSLSPTQIGYSPVTDGKCQGYWNNWAIRPHRGTNHFESPNEITANKGVQGTRHKVPGPLTRDVGTGK